jgi:hypothetical protein
MLVLRILHYLFPVSLIMTLIRSIQSMLYVYNPFIFPHDLHISEASIILQILTLHHPALGDEVLWSAGTLTKLIFTLPPTSPN